MFHDIHSLNSPYNIKSNIITAIEVRMKVIFVLLCLIINLISPSFITPLIVASLSLVALLISGIHIKKLALRLVIPLIMAIVIMFTQIFFYGNTPLLIITIGNLKITAYIEGLNHGILIVCRVIAGVLLILFLSMTTPTHKLIMAASWFRMPKPMVELLFLIYRYIFVLFEEMLCIREAQKVRLGYSNWRRSMNSLSSLGGSLILRAYDRANHVFDAMMARGYNGATYAVHTEHLRKRDYLIALVMAGIITLLSLTIAVKGL